MKLIEEKKLAKLLRNSAKLAALENGGVDNWEWYSHSLNDNNYWEEFDEKSDEELTKDYKDVIIETDK